jgi:HK97 gp10 family phage protein
MARSRNGLVVVTGVPAIDRRLKTLEPKVQRKYVRKSIRSGLKVVAAGVKAEAPAVTGATRRAVKVRAVKQRRRGAIEMEVRIAADETTVKVSAGTGKRAFIPAIVEFGRKGVEPDPFARRAYEAKGDLARDIAQRELVAGVEKEASAR